MYHVSHQGQQFGPYTVEQINEYLAQGAFDASSHVWDANANGWVPIGQLPGVILPAVHGPTIVPTKPARASNSGLAFSIVGILLFVVSVFFIITRMGKADDWEFGTENRPPSDLAAIISLNMIHISPISVAKNLFRGAGDYLSATGKLFLYGPFKRNGEHTAPSNAQFDAILRARDPAWGVRDVTDLEEFASANDLLLDPRVPMPSNNFTLIFSRRN